MATRKPKIYILPNAGWVYNLFPGNKEQETALRLFCMRMDRLWYWHKKNAIKGV